MSDLPDDSKALDGSKPVDVYKSVDVSRRALENLKGLYNLTCRHGNTAKKAGEMADQAFEATAKVENILQSAESDLGIVKSNLVITRDLVKMTEEGDINPLDAVTRPDFINRAESTICDLDTLIPRVRSITEAARETTALARKTAVEIRDIVVGIAKAKSEINGLHLQVKRAPKDEASQDKVEPPTQARPPQEPELAATGKGNPYSTPEAQTTKAAATEDYYSKTSTTGTTPSSIFKRPLPHDLGGWNIIVARPDNTEAYRMSAKNLVPEGVKPTPFNLNLGWFIKSVRDVGGLWHAGLDLHIYWMWIDDLTGNGSMLKIADSGSSSAGDIDFGLAINNQVTRRHHPNIKFYAVFGDDVEPEMLSGYDW